MHSFSHPTPQPADRPATTAVADYYEKPAISYGALRTAVIGLLAVVCVIGSLLLYWLHAPATPVPASAGQPAPSAQLSSR